MLLAERYDYMNDNKIRMFSEEYENEQTGEIVNSVTVMIDGKFKQVLDIVVQKEGIYDTYLEAIRDILLSGLETFVSRYK
jgi:hypothetical protein